MLRVEASNLPSPRPAARSRRLHASSSPALRRGASTSRHEILPPPSPLTTKTELAPSTSSPLNAERWSVRLELIDDDVARLYGHGLARGALVWKKGMVEWRPLLITPELGGLLRSTRITLHEPTPAAEPSDPVTSPRLPAPSRLPSDLLAGADAPQARAPLTVAPLALDIPAPSAPQRRYDVAVAALLSFGVAWFAHGSLNPSFEPPPLAAASVPAAVAPQASLATTSAPAAIATIPRVSIADLPLLGDARGTDAVVAPARAPATRSASTHEDGPSRSELVSALSRVNSAASGCGERGGAVRLVITFATSGVARSISVSGPELPAQTRSCIIGAASRARVPAFNGSPVTVSKTL